MQKSPLSSKESDIISSSSDWDFAVFAGFPLGTPKSQKMIWVSLSDAVSW